MYNEREDKILFGVLSEGITEGRRGTQNVRMKNKETAHLYMYII
jgi:hypothetical protein